jgi:predicted Rossmann fold flavoprotein
MNINELKTLIRGALLNEQVPGVNFAETKQVVVEELMKSMGINPEMSYKQMKRNLDFSIVEEVIAELLPKKLIPVVIELSNIPSDKKVHDITKTERLNLVNVIKNFKMTVKGLRPISEAIITSGGIKVTEISPSDMQSKIVKGLYFCGEVIDVDAYTGGYNLQIAFSTGYLAGLSASE